MGRSKDREQHEQAVHRLITICALDRSADRLELPVPVQVFRPIPKVDRIKYDTKGVAHSLHLREIGLASRIVRGENDAERGRTVHARYTSGQRAGERIGEGVKGYLCSEACVDWVWVWVWVGVGVCFEAMIDGR